MSARARSERSQRVRAAGAILAAAVGLAAIPGPGSEVSADDVYGLVVGIDDYAPSVGPLAGAVNDARDIADALKASGAREVRVLLDADATRENFMAAWRELVQRAGPDDQLIVSYAGHGAQEPERIAGSESDGKDEVWLMHGFAVTGPGRAQRVRDDDIADLLKEASHLRTVIFISDSCHSGTMTRSFDSRAGVRRTRMATYGSIEDDPLPPPPAAGEPAQADNLLMFAAVPDHLEVEETVIDGKPRGALSWAASEGLRGAADSNADGAITKGELELFVRHAIRRQMQGRQQPQVAPQGRARSVILPPKPMSVALLNAEDAAQERRIAQELQRVQVVQRTENPRLIWDIATNEMISHHGDLVAELTAKKRAFKRLQANNVPLERVELPLDRVQAVIDRWRMVEQIGRLSDRAPLTVTIEPGDQLYGAGDRVSVSVAGLHHRFLTLFNVASDGTLNFLYPLTSDGYNDSLQVDPTQPPRLTLEVQPPFGAEHFVAIASAAALSELHRLLARHQGRKVDETLVPAVRTALDGTDHQLGIHGAYTSPKSGTN